MRQNCRSSRKNDRLTRTVHFWSDVIPIKFDINTRFWIRRKKITINSTPISSKFFPLHLFWHFLVFFWAVDFNYSCFWSFWQNINGFWLILSEIKVLSMIVHLQKILKFDACQHATSLFRQKTTWMYHQFTTPIPHPNSPKSSYVFSYVGVNYASLRLLYDREPSLCTLWIRIKHADPNYIRVII